MSRHDDRVTKFILREAGIYLAREATGQSMITVTRVALSANGEHATIFVTVFPPKETGPALSYLARSAHDFRTHLAKHSHLHPVPKIGFVLDEGELNRQRLDEIQKDL